MYITVLPSPFSRLLAFLFLPRHLFGIPASHLFFSHFFHDSRPVFGLLPPAPLVTRVACAHRALLLTRAGTEGEVGQLLKVIAAQLFALLENWLAGLKLGILHDNGKNNQTHFPQNMQ